MGLGFYRGRDYRRTNGQKLTKEQRFWMKVDRQSDPTACWVWLGARLRSGYGVVRLAGKTRTAPSVSLEIDGRPLGYGQVACHHCDNPPCVNPAHLYAGSHTENNLDMLRRGRSKASKLCPAKVLEIRRRLAQGERGCDVARSMGVSKYAVSDIKRGKAWGHL